MPEQDVFVAPLVIEYPFSRTTGPVIGAFLTGLREGVLVGSKASDGRVLVNPTTNAYTVPLGAVYYRLDGSPATSVTLGPESAEILRTQPGSEVAPEG